MLTINLFGPLELRGPDGQDLLPRGRKSQAVLALLAASPRHCRPRSWLQDKLWSDRAQDQGAGSLRQCLSEIRRALGDFRDVLISDNRFVTLDPALLTIVTQRTGGVEAQEAFEGLDVRDPEFEHWIREFRAAAAGDYPAGGAPEVTPDVSEGQVVDAECLSNVAYPPKEVVLGLPDPDPVLYFERAKASSELIELFNEEFCSQIAIALRDIGGIRAMDPVLNEAKPQNGFILRCKTNTFDTTFLQRVELYSAEDRKLIWNASRNFKCTGSLPLEQLETRELCQHSVTSVLSWLSAERRGDSSKHLLARALKLLFSLDPANLDAAEDLLIAAYEMDPQAICLAWRAFLKMTQVLEHRPTEAQRLCAEASELVDQAYRDDPNNAVVQAIAAQVRLLVDDDPKSALFFAKRAVELDGSNPFAWGYYALSMAHLGKPETAHLNAKRARFLAKSSPYVYWWDMLCCLTACSAENLEEATIFAENVRAVKPTYRPALRYLYPLYRSQNKLTSSQKVLSQMQVLEPGFQPTMLAGDSYPSATLRKTRLVEHI
ncbi:DNA-binding transcriptional activator of the SARP family protein [Tritonibacter multivorans]|uniref:DNA-binding transcriptional activator of the SARP family protein n=1 Tax=Tritonibacter multivorans TaxID=928856 RepID=A0A0P1GJE0_9RHOB|nr:hypothetical protein [Tritonibacter multivorans]MDA7421680.1 hypothetical protein [Tritonibacter multivorans]CUH81948.1 DNA-binding transcriptional activator of the SARP family protein [Tritonibacter multivorans]SFC91683.1 transcriptional regulator, SARP family [Tritonibacter multivorans]